MDVFLVVGRLVSWSCLLDSGVLLQAFEPLRSSESGEHVGRQSECDSKQKHSWEERRDNVVELLAEVGFHRISSP